MECPTLVEQLLRETRVGTDGFRLNLADLGQSLVDLSGQHLAKFDQHWHSLVHLDQIQPSSANIDRNLPRFGKLLPMSPTHRPLSANFGRLLKTCWPDRTNIGHNLAESWPTLGSRIVQQLLGLIPSSRCLFESPEFCRRAPVSSSPSHDLLLLLVVCSGRSLSGVGRRGLLVGPPNSAVWTSVAPKEAELRLRQQGRRGVSLPLSAKRGFSRTLLLQSSAID